jgi:hypothetical protein
MPKKPTEVSGRFGKLLVLHCNLPPRKRVLVRCDCGKEFAVQACDLLLGRTSSCGGAECSSRAYHLEGQKFGYLEVLFLSKTKNTHGELMWCCKCECGKTRRVKTYNLLNGLVKSCGCKSDILRSANNTKPLKEVAINTLWRRYKNGAKNRNLDFSLSKEDFEEFFEQNCYYCNSPPTNTFIAKNMSGDRVLKYNGIDRINSEIGYIKENCVPCCMMCNLSKSNNSLEDFLIWAKNLANHQKFVLNYITNDKKDK